MPSSFFGANLHSFFFFTKSFYLVNDDFHLCSENRFIQGMSFFYGGSSFEGNSTVWQLHHFRDSSESFDLQSRQIWEQGKRTRSVNSWFSHLSVCSLSLFHLLLDQWIILKFTILHSSYASFGQAGQDLIDFVNILGNCALKGESKLAKIFRKRIWEDDWKMNKLT